jgi:hypothetical protein
MPRKEASLKDKEGSVHVYTGVSIQDILAKAGLLPERSFMVKIYQNICWRNVRTAIRSYFH